jgi:hypothetical protein
MYVLTSLGSGFILFGLGCILGFWPPPAPSKSTAPSNTHTKWILHP